MRQLQADLQRTNKSCMAETDEFKLNVQQLPRLWKQYKSEAEKKAEVSEGNFHTLTALHHSAAAVRCVPIGELRPLLLQAMDEQSMTTPDNYEMGADYWHGKTELQKSWTKEMHQKLTIHKGPSIAFNKLMRSENNNIFEHAQKHWRRCSERSKEVFEANSDKVYEHIRLMQPQTSAYWTSINWQREHCSCGSAGGHKGVGSKAIQSKGVSSHRRGRTGLSLLGSTMTFTGSAQKRSIRLKQR